MAEDELPRNPALAMAEMAKRMFPGHEIDQEKVDRLAAYCDAPMTPLERAEMALRKELGLDWPYTGNDGLRDAARAVLLAIRDHAAARQEGADWAAEYGESAEAAVAASDMDSVIRYIDAALAEEG